MYIPYIYQSAASFFKSIKRKNIPADISLHPIIKGFEIQVYDN